MQHAVLGVGRLLGVLGLMPEFKFAVGVNVVNQRAAARHPHAEGLLSLRGLVIEAVDETQARVRAMQVMEALNRAR